MRTWELTHHQKAEPKDQCHTIPKTLETKPFPQVAVVVVDAAVVAVVTLVFF
jgi:hypothetical protein